MIVADGVIAITGDTIVREPLVSMRVSIRCPYTPQLTREYMLFVDPATTTPQPAAAPVAAPVEAPVVARPVAPAPQTTVRRDETVEPIANASQYLVRPGDSLSEIAQRIENRPVGLWAAANAIFAANPDAFMNNDMNRLKAGTWLTIPDLGAGQPLTVAAPATADTATADTATAAVPAAMTGTAYEPEALAEEAAPVREPVSILETPAGTAANEPAPAQEPTAELQPGDVIVDPIDSVADDSIVIPDTELEGPAATSSQPNVPTAIIRPVEPVSAQPVNWLAWFVGGSIALIASLLLFGWLRGRFGSTPIGAASAQPLPAESGNETQPIEALADPDYDLDDDSPTAENLALDADLVLGTGLDTGTEVEVVEQFAFANTTNLDLELPEEVSSGGAKADTDIIPPLNIDPESILESEVLPGDEDDDYDMSVIVDATKMPDPEDVTERDLEAIEVPDDDETLITGDYTVSQEVDYKILEQDYEDEMTATQRLNEEIQKAAEDLASRIDETSEEETKEMSMASVHELDVTAQMHGRNDDEIDDDTDVERTVDLEAEDKTVEMAEDKTVEMAEDNTVEMPKRGKAG